MYRKEVLFVRVSDDLKEKLNVLCYETHKTKGEVLEELIGKEYERLKEFISGGNDGQSGVCN